MIKKHFLVTRDYVCTINEMILYKFTEGDELTITVNGSIVEVRAKLQEWGESLQLGEISRARFYDFVNFEGIDWYDELIDIGDEVPDGMILDVYFEDFALHYGFPCLVDKETGNKVEYFHHE